MGKIMGRYVLLFLILAIAIAGCTTQEIVCNSPYITTGKVCCLDANSNGICDKEENSTEIAVEEKVKITEQKTPQVPLATPESEREQVEVTTPEQIPVVEETISETEYSSKLGKLMSAFAQNVTSYQFRVNKDKYFVRGDRVKIIFDDVQSKYRITINGKNFPQFYYDTVYLNLDKREAVGFCEGFDENTNKRCEGLNIKDIPLDLDYNSYNIKLPEDWLMEFLDRTYDKVEENKYYIAGHQATLVAFRGTPPIDMYFAERSGLPIRIIQRYSPAKVTDFLDLATNIVRDEDVRHLSKNEISQYEQFLSTSPY